MLFLLNTVFISISPISQSEERKTETFIVVQQLKLCLAMQGVWVQSLVKELRSHIPETKKQNRKKTENCNKFNKEFKKKAR